MTPAAIVSALHDRGSDARDLRDAIHEARHGLDVCADAWDRETIHRLVMRLPRVDQVDAEIDARAAEWAACDAHGIEYEVEDWVLVCAMEAIKNGIAAPFDFWLTAIRERRASDGDRLFREVVEFLGRAA